MQAAHISQSACNPYALMRSPQRAEDLSKIAFRWMATLPRDCRPIETGRRYARIVNRIAAIWEDEVLTMDYLNSLTISDRPHRQGFPPEVGREIAALSRLASERLPASLFDPWGDRKYA